MPDPSLSSQEGGVDRLDVTEHWLILRIEGDPRTDRLIPPGQTTPDDLGPDEEIIDVRRADLHRGAVDRDVIAATADKIERRLNDGGKSSPISLAATGGQYVGAGHQDPRLIETLARVIENRHGTLHGIGSTLREALAEYARGR